MKLHRFFIKLGDISAGEIRLSDKEAISQIRKVLRLDIGDILVFLDGSGKEYLSELTGFGKDFLQARIKEAKENRNEPELKIILCQAMCKKDKFEWVLQKGTEIGVSGFIPVLADRSEKLGFNGERAVKILKESAEQSERGILPELREIQKFADVLKNFHGEKIILDKSGDPIGNFNFETIGSQLALFIGPEGGWTDEELNVAKEGGARVVSIGRTVLRTETAGAVAAAILLNR